LENENREGLWGEAVPDALLFIRWETGPAIHLPVNLLLLVGGQILPLLIALLVALAVLGRHLPVLIHPLAVHLFLGRGEVLPLVVSLSGSRVFLSPASAAGASPLGKDEPGWDIAQFG